jgi:TonB family protein
LVSNPQEVEMRLAVLAVAALLSMASLGAVPQELLTEPGPVERRANPIGPENPLPRRVLSVTPHYPPDAAAIDAAARVTLRITLGALGRVEEMRPLNVPLLVFPAAPADAKALQAAAAALVTAATDAVRQWQYDPPANPPIAFSVTIGFGPGVEPALVAQDASVPPRRPDRAEPPPPPPSLPPLPELPPAPWADGAVRIGGGVGAPVKVKNVSPVYPQTAMAERIQGVVILEARIGPEGRVTNARVLRSIPLLDQAALDAVLQWEFSPTLMNGTPVPVIKTITIQFSVS